MYRWTPFFCTLDYVFFSLMVGLGESFFAAFVLHEGHPDWLVAVLTTLTLAFGGMLQILTPRMVLSFQSVKNWTVFCAIAQACALGSLAISAYFKIFYAPLSFVLISFYWAFGLSAGSAWNAWIARILPKSGRGSFFGMRMMIGSAAIFCGLYFGSHLLREMEPRGLENLAFAFLFGVGAFFRIFSSILLSAHPDAKEVLEDFQKNTFSENLNILKKSKMRSVFLVSMTAKTGLYFSSGYFAPFLIHQLQYNFSEFMQTLACGFLGRLIALPIVVKLYKATTLKTYMITVCTLLTPIPVFWFLGDSRLTMGIIQASQGALLAAFEFGTFMAFFENLNHKEKIPALSTHNVFQMVSIAIGVLCGTWVFVIFGQSTEAYGFVFITSALIRVTSIWFANLISNPNLKNKIQDHDEMKMAA